MAEYLKLNIAALKMFGIWKEPNIRKPNTLKNMFDYIRKNLLIYVVIVYLLQIILYLLTILNDPFEAFDTVHSIAQYFLVLVKIGFIKLPQRKVQEIIDRIRYEENRIQRRNQQEQQIYFAWIKRNRKITTLYWCIFTASNIYYFVMGPIMFVLVYPEERIPIPIKGWVPWNLTNKKLYYATFLYSSIIAGGVIFLLLVADAFYVSLIIFGLGQFEIIQQAIKDLSPNNQEKEIVNIIKHHYRVIEYFNIIDAYLKPLSNITFVVTAIILCNVAIRILFDNVILHQVMEFMYLFYLLMQLLYYFWFGNEVIVQSENVGTAVSESNWYEFCPQVKKNLLILVERTKKPVTISTGVIHIISLETYIMLVKTAYTILAVFQAVVQRDEN